MKTFRISFGLNSAQRTRNIQFLWTCEETETLSLTESKGSSSDSKSLSFPASVLKAHPTFIYKGPKIACLKIASGKVL